MEVSVPTDQDKESRWMRNSAASGAQPMPDGVTNHHRALTSVGTQLNDLTQRPPPQGQTDPLRDARDSKGKMLNYNGRQMSSVRTDGNLQNIAYGTYPGGSPAASEAMIHQVKDYNRKNQPADHPLKQMGDSAFLSIQSGTAGPLDKQRSLMGMHSEKLSKTALQKYEEKNGNENSHTAHKDGILVNVDYQGKEAKSCADCSTFEAKDRVSHWAGDQPKHPLKGSFVEPGKSYAAAVQANLPPNQQKPGPSTDQASSSKAPKHQTTPPRQPPGPQVFQTPLADRTRQRSSSGSSGGMVPETPLPRQRAQVQVPETPQRRPSSSASHVPETPLQGQQQRRPSSSASQVPETPQQVASSSAQVQVPATPLGGDKRSRKVTPPEQKSSGTVKETPQPKKKKKKGPN
jgi:hypothetical protein